MRIIPSQPSLRPAYVDHKRAHELQAISHILDENRKILTLVQRDLVDEDCDPHNGRPGMNAEQVLRSLVLKTIRGVGYRDLEFHLADSRSYRAFCRFGAWENTPSSSALQENISSLSAETLEAINRIIVRYAADEQIEEGRRCRYDCTVVESDIHPPSDSTLLADSVRKLSDVFEDLRDTFGIHLRRRHRSAKKRARHITYARNSNERAPLYKELLSITKASVRDAYQGVEQLSALEFDDHETTQKACKMRHRLQHWIGLSEQVIDQTERRVLKGESVPASEKIVSIFEPHTDIIIKGRRDVHYGHKVCIGTGTSGLVTDCLICEGNPADSTLSVQMIHRHNQLYDSPPKQVAYDGGFASQDNVTDIKELGVSDVAFTKRCGLAIEEMARSTKIYRMLQKFRAGIEAWISFLKRAVGLNRCPWKGLGHFRSYVWSSVVSANLLTLARKLQL